MEADVIALVNTGATTLLGLMVTDAWGRAKKAAAALFGRGRDDTLTAIESDLEDSRGRLLTALSAGDTETEAELTAEWRSRLRRAVEDEHVVASLHEFVDQYRDVVNDYADHATNISIHAQAYHGGRVYQQGQGTQHNY